MLPTEGCVSHSNCPRLPCPWGSLRGVVPEEEKQRPLDSNWRPKGQERGFPVPLLARSWEPPLSEGVCGRMLLSERFWGGQGSVGGQGQGDWALGWGPLSGPAQRPLASLGAYG